MRFFFFTLLSVFSGPLFSQNMCTNLNFEAIAPAVYTTATIPGWTLASQSMTAQPLNTCLSQTNWVAGSPEFSVWPTPILGVPYIGNLPHSPLGGTVVARLNNTVGNNNATKLSRSFTVSPTNPYLSYALAFDGENVPHECCQNTRIEINFKNSIGAVIPCLSQTISPQCSSGFSITGTHAWSNWQTYTVNLTTQPSTLVTLEVIAYDCNYGGHYLSCFFDAICSAGGPGYSINTNAGDNGQRVSWCAGTNTALITAPPGIAGYTWSVPPTASVLPANLNSTLLTVTNPSPGLTFTITTLSGQGCLAATVYTLIYTAVSVSPALTSAACGSQANGGATIQATGSSAGYSVSLYNSSGVLVGTGNSLSNNNLSSGNYTAYITTTAAGCGSASSAFYVPAYNQSIALNLSQIGLCSGQSSILLVNASPTLNTSNANFSWTPSTFLGSTNNISTVLTPTTAPGSSLAVIYTVAVNPFSMPQCVFTATANLNVSNPIPPVLSFSQVVCDNSAPFQISASPAYQGFFTANPAACMSSAGMFSPAISSGTCIFAYVYSYAGCSSVTATDSIFVLQAPSLSLSATHYSMCQGQTSTLSVSGAPQFTWSTAAVGPTIAITPTSNTVVSASGSNSTGCISTASLALTVSPLPNISVTPTQVCFYPPGTFTATGADTYSWSGGATGSTLQPQAVSVGINTIQVSGIFSASQCSASVTHSFTVYHPVFTLAGDSVVCSGVEYTFTASGCTSYTWNSSFVGSTYTSVAHSAQMLTHVVLAENNGCQVTDSITLRVDECIGIRESVPEKNSLFFPNPSRGLVQIIPPADAELLIWDTSGRCLVRKFVQALVQETVLLSPGTYIAGLISKEGMQLMKLLILND